MSQTHHASEHTARARHALTRKVMGDGDGDFWNRKMLMHMLIARRPACHADMLTSFAFMADSNPSLPGILKNLVHGTKAASDSTPDAAPLK